jgi:DNA-binding beta-propeller fold protein YncE
MKRGYGMGSPAIAEWGPGELAIIMNELNVVEFVDFKNGNQQYTTAYHQGNVTSMAIKDQRIAIGFHNRIDIVNKTGGGTVVSFVASSPKFLYIDSESRLFYYESNKIVCRSMEGKELFSRTNDDLADIRGMTFDTKGNIYVSSGGRNTVSVLSGDDRSITTDILTEKDGLTQPSFVHFSPNGKHLLVINNNNMQMLLFDII